MLRQKHHASRKRTQLLHRLLEATYPLQMVATSSNPGSAALTVSLAAFWLAVLLIVLGVVLDWSPPRFLPPSMLILAVGQIVALVLGVVFRGPRGKAAILLSLVLLALVVLAFGALSVRPVEGDGPEPISAVE